MEKTDKIPKPTLQERIDHLRNGTTSCIICGAPTIVGNFTDYDGEIRCEVCGMPYQTEGNKIKVGDLRRIYGLNPDQVAKVYTPFFTNAAVLKEFWEKTGKKIPLGMYDGTEPPFSEDEYVELWLYVWGIRDRLLPDFEEDFAWYSISVMAGEPISPEGI